MNKLTYFLIILIIPGCSLNSNSKFWTAAEKINKEVTPDNKIIIDETFEEDVLNEEFNQTEKDIPSDTEINSEVSTFRFEGINDSKSIDEVYDQAILELNDKDFQAAKQSFNYLATNFNDDEKIPLSLFWLGEISLLESNLEQSENFFQRLASDFPDHWRTPLAHKKIGDILMMSGDSSAARIKYQFVVQTFPENTASSLALQLLENME